MTAIRIIDAIRGLDRFAPTYGLVTLELKPVNKALEELPN